MTPRSSTADQLSAEVKLNLHLRISMMLANAKNTEQAIKQTLEELVTVLFPHHGAIWSAYWTLDPTEQRLSIEQCYTAGDNALAEFERISSSMTFATGEGLPGRVWHDHIANYIPHVATDQSLPRLEHLARCGLESALAFPVMHNGKVVGIVEFATQKHFAVDSTVLDLLNALGTQIGALITAKRLAHQNAELARLPLQAPVAIIATTRSRVILNWNYTAQKMFGCSIENALGRQAESVLPADLMHVLRELRPRVDAGEHIVTYPADITVFDSTKLPVELDYGPSYDENGNLAGSVVVVRDNSARKEAEKRINEFYSVVSHELRTPLTSIRGAIGLLESGAINPASADGVELLHVARESADRLIRLVNDILDLKKIEAGKMDLHPREFGMDTLITEAVKSMHGMAEQFSINVACDLSANANVNADWDKTTQVLTNLLSNAIKFSPEQSTVTVRTRVRDHKVRVSVIDRGCGISAEDMPKLFGKFQQLDSSNTRRHAGTGLGLVITKAIVEQQNGTVGVESTIGSGSAFWFELPIA